MLGTRHEEYVNFEDKIPFKYQKAITRTAETFSTEINWHENLEIQLCVFGEGTVMLDGNKLNFNVGDVIVANSNVMHHTGTDSIIKYDCLILDSTFCKNAGIETDCLTFRAKIKDPRLPLLFEEIDDLINSDSPLRIARSQHIALEILMILRKDHTAGEKATIDVSDDRRAVKDAIEYIQCNYDKKISLSDIARTLFIDKYRLTRIFKKCTGKTVFEYINGFRCKQAYRLINEGLSVSEAANMCGFSNMSFFTRTFKKYIGRVPSELKKH